MKSLSTSVIICTLNRSAFLRRMLDALHGQRAFEGDFEVLVIDNGSTDDTEAVATNMDLGSVPLRFIREPKTGLSRARNRGLSESRCRIVAFIDDDAVPQEHWLERLTEPFFTVKPEPAVVAGEVTPEWGAPRPPWLGDGMLGWFSARAGWGDTPRPLSGGEWVLEANCAARRQSLQDVGGFPEELGRIGASLLSGDHLAFEYLREKGEVIYFEPRSIVRHHIHASRLNQAWLRRRAFFQGVTDAISNRLRTERGFAEKPIKLELPTDPKAWKLATAGRNSDVANEVLRFQIRFHRTMGYLLQKNGIFDAG